MSVRAKLTGVIMLALCVSGFAWNDGSWRRAEGIQDREIFKVFPHPRKPSTLFIATDKALYIREDQNPPRASFYLKSSNEHINDFYIPLNTPSTFLAATQSGLFLSQDEGQNWQRIFSPSGNGSGIVHSVIASHGRLFAGTSFGLYMKKDFESSWSRMPEFPSFERAELLREHDGYIFIGSAHALYRHNPVTGEFIKIFTAGIQKETIEGEDASFITRLKGRDIRDFSYSQSRKTLYLVTSGGIFQSRNFGKDWKQINHGSLPVDEATSIVVLQNNGEETLAVSSLKGVYIKSHDDSWQQTFAGLSTNTVYDVVASGEGKLIAATDQGLFFIPVQQALAVYAGQDNVSPDVFDSLIHHYAYEPTIGEVHSLAVDYAEVHPDKIKSWRKLARKKAWLPSVSVGVDGGEDRTYSDSIFGSSSGNHHIAPDDKTYGDDFGWDVSMSWDFSDLVWSTDQTTIDSRSKLMVELREDILDQVTRLYYERRRLQFEMRLDSSGHKADSVNRHLRVEELTALIDSYTGGKFSQLIKERILTDGVRETYEVRGKTLINHGVE